MTFNLPDAAARSMPAERGGKVSIVIPTYNRAYCLPATLASVQRQTYENWEALVVDDGSTDETAAVIRALQREDPRIKYHVQPNRGVARARNTGLKMADGDWIAFLDSDDAWLPWKLAAQIACLERLPDVGMIWTDLDAVDASGTVVSRNHLRKFYGVYQRLGDEAIFQHHTPLCQLAPSIVQSTRELSRATVRWGDVYQTMIGGSLVHTSTVVMRRERARAVGLFDERYRTGEDYDFHLRTCREGPVALLDEPSVLYRIAGGADQLTARRYRAEIARNGLRTREAALARDRARISLPRSELRRIMADAHEAVAVELFDLEDFAGARPHFVRSLPAHWRRPRMVVKCALTFLPGPLARAVSRLARRSESPGHNPPHCPLPSKARRR